MIDPWLFGGYTLIMVAVMILLFRACYEAGRRAGYNPGYISGKRNEQWKTDIWIQRTLNCIRLSHKE